MDRAGYETEILRVAELAITQFRDAGRHLPVEAELRHLIDQANQEPRAPFLPGSSVETKASDTVERVRVIMMSVPELEAFLRGAFPAGTRPWPFKNRRIHHR
jgi:hypothetical protein